jgi:hypothetical protein
MNEAAGLVFGAHGGYLENGKFLAIDLHSQGANRNILNSARGIGFFEYDLESETLEFKETVYRVKTKHSNSSTSEFYDMNCEDYSNPVYPEWPELTA